MGSPSTGAPNANGVGTNCVFRPTGRDSRSLRFRLPYRQKFVSIRRGCPHPLRCAGGGIRGVSSTTYKCVDHIYGPVDINDVGCRESLFITHFSVTCTVCDTEHRMLAVQYL